MIMLQVFSGLQIQIFNSFQISLVKNTDREAFCEPAVLKCLVKTLD